jgi:uncharacterized protein involved in response to NO
MSKLVSLVLVCLAFAVPAVLFFSVSRRLDGADILSGFFVSAGLVALARAVSGTHRRRDFFLIGGAMASVGSLFLLLRFIGVIPSFG